MNAPTDWVSAIAILAAGLVLGALFLVFSSRRKSKQMLGDEPDLDLKDLEAKRDALLQQLRDPSLNADERTRLEVETANVLRQLDARAPLPAARKGEQGVGSPSPRPAKNPALKGFLWGAASFAALAALGYFVMQSSAPRQDGGSVTGGDTAQQQIQAQKADPAVLGLETAVQKDPNNLQLRNDLAQAYLERDNLMAVFEQTRFVLEKSPNDSRALTYQALVRMAMGEGDSAIKMLQQATKSDPKNLDSRVALAWVYAQTGKMAEAEKMIAEAVKQSPNDKARLEQVFVQMKEAAKRQSQVVAEGSELPAGHPSIEGGTSPAAAVASPDAATPRPAAPQDGKSVQVTLDLDPAATLKSGILYVMARNPMGGPPVAVKRMQVSSFPVTFQFGSADSMMGQPLPDKFRLEARLDSDGDAATKRPTDPSVMQADVAPGAILKLALK